MSDIAVLAEDDDWLVSMRAMDLLEKLAHEHPERVEPYKRLFIGALADTDKWEIQLQIVRALPCAAGRARSGAASSTFCSETSRIRKRS